MIRTLTRRSLWLALFALFALAASGCMREREAPAPPLWYSQLLDTSSHRYDLRDGEGARQLVLKRRGSAHILSSAAGRALGKASVRRAGQRVAVRAPGGALLGYTRRVEEGGAIELRGQDDALLASLTPDAALPEGGWIVRDAAGAPLRALRVLASGAVISLPAPPASADAAAADALAALAGFLSLFDRPSELEAADAAPADDAAASAAGATGDAVAAAGATADAVGASEAGDDAASSAVGGLAVLATGPLVVQRLGDARGRAPITVRRVSADGQALSLDAAAAVDAAAAATVRALGGDAAAGASAEAGSAAPREVLLTLERGAEMSELGVALLLVEGLAPPLRLGLAVHASKFIAGAASEAAAEQAPAEQAPTEQAPADAAEQGSGS